LIRLTRFVNRLLRPLIHREYLSETHALEFAHESVEGMHELLKKPGLSLLGLLLAVLAKSLQAVNLMLVFLAFGVPFSGGTIIAAFSLIMLFVVVSPTPGGLGVVEGTMPLVLSSFGIPMGTAVVLMLAYRGTSFWPQVLLGIPALRLLSKNPDTQPA
jgi:glycosyltransferase 2 family protein